ncbi:hypothetical protein AALB53_09075 [Lachnospiraceae bacterium 47-T17]
MDAITEILGRLVGPLILTAALGVFFFNSDQISILISNVKAEYLDNTVYSEKSREYTTEGIEYVTCDQLRSILANGTDYTVIVLDIEKMRKYVIAYEFDHVGIETYTYTAANPNGVLLNTQAGIDSVLSAIGSSGKFTVTPEYDLANRARRIVYRKV